MLVKCSCDVDRVTARCLSSAAVTSTVLLNMSDRDGVAAINTRLLPPQFQPELSKLRLGLERN
jgi:hypothetical protein